MFNISDRFVIQLRDVLADAVIVPFTSILVNTWRKFHLFAAILSVSWQMCTFPLISFRELSASAISAFSSRSCRPSVVWPETTSSAAASLTMQTAGRPWWTLLSVRLERCCCFCVSFMIEATVFPEQLHSLRIQRGPLCFARFYHEFVSSRFSSDPGKITVFYLPSEESVIQINARVCSIEDILKADGDSEVNTWICPCLFQEHAADLCICCVDLLKDNNGDIVTVCEPSFSS